MFSRKIPYFEFFAIEVVFSLSCISQANEVQTSYSGTLLYTRDKEQLFGTKIDGVFSIIFEDIGS